MTPGRWLFVAGILCLLPMETVSAQAEPVSWHSLTNGRWAQLPVPSQGRTGFTWLAPRQTGLTFTNALEELAGAANRVLLNGAGVATGDFDGDGRSDVFFCSLSGRSALYRNLGNMRFEDVTAAAGLTLSNRITRGAVFADLDGNGWTDLLVSTLASGVACFRNDGQGRFTETTAVAGTSSNYGSVTLTLADIDGNGTLDLYITNYRGEDIRDRGEVSLHLVKGQMVVPPPLKDRLLVVNGQVIEYGQPDQLLLNDGTGKFTPVSWTDGSFLDENGQPLASPPLDWGLTAGFRDLNRDGHPDLYVCNDYWTPDRIWINDGHGRFRALPKLAIRQTSSSSMGVDFADLDRDGYIDFMVTDMLSRDLHLRKRQMPARWPIPDPKDVIEHRPQTIQNTLFRNRGDNTYEETAYFSGVAGTDWSWQPVFLDVDLDGFADLLVPAGHVRDVQDMDAERQIRARQHSWKGFTNMVERQRAFTRELMMHMRLYPPLTMPIFAFRNTGDFRFEETTSHWGTAQPGVHHSLALADLDNDGDLDLLVNNLNSPAGVYRNESSAPRVIVRLKGRPPNTQGIGAHVELRGGALPVQVEEMVAGGRYLSGSEAVVVFAAGSTGQSMSLEVRWRNGSVTRCPDVAANRIYEIEEKGSAHRPRPNPPTPTPLFTDISSSITHLHKENPYDDFARQPLLPRKLSQLGPGVAWFDLDQDGWDDLLVGAARGGTLGAFRNRQGNGFAPWTEPPFNAAVTRDQPALVAFTSTDGVRIIAASSNYEDGLAAGSAARIYDLGQKRLDDSLPGQPSSSGPVALADLDADGDLDLFLGGRCLPGRYPEPASSLILRFNSGRWETDELNTKTLRSVGMVSGAVWSDLTDDGLPELILACEWGPVRVFKNERGQLSEITAALGLDQFVGWWNGVSTGDINGDGRLDIVAANWGLNSEYEATRQAPLRLYYGNLAGRDAVDLIEAVFDPALNDYTPRRRVDLLTPSLPYLLGRFSTAKAFSDAAIGAFLDVKRSDIGVVEAGTLTSMVFLNRGGRFEGRELPRDAQLAPAFAVNVADFNGDGREDVFLSQNFFETEVESARLDAGRGLLLVGDDEGRLRPLPGHLSGIQVYGQQRGAAISDFDQDGRPDLVVTQNSAATRLFRNTGGKPGLRVKLAGPPGNPNGVGAALRLMTGTVQGPVRAVLAGSGYGSQNSLVQVLASAHQPERVWVRWPGGKETTTAIPSGCTELTIGMSGEASRVKLRAGANP